MPREISFLDWDIKTEKLQGNLVELAQRNGFTVLNEEDYCLGITNRRGRSSIGPEAECSVCYRDNTILVKQDESIVQDGRRLAEIYEKEGLGTWTLIIHDGRTAVGEFYKKLFEERKVK